jgi:tetratricopeptide (TPR) repeat protein
MSKIEHLPGQLLAGAQSSRDIVQDFVPLSRSLEWDLGQEYLRQRGNKAFISDASPVPFVINNDGTLSRHAAEVFFLSLTEAERAETLPNEIRVLELGIGVGLFARFFLDHFQVCCRQQKKDYYQRLTYIAADRSARMLTDVLRHGVLAGHVGRFRVRQVDAMQPDDLLPLDVGLPQGEKPLRAIFLNYLLDCLPCAVLKFESDKPTQLCVRTCVARSVKLSDFTDLSAEQLRKRAKSNDPKSRQDLLEVYGLFASEYDYKPVETKDLPYGDFAAEYARRTSKNLLHSYGAIQSIEKLLRLVADNGFILVNDYGQTQTTRENEFEHQRFSLATAVGINFPEVEAYFNDGRCKVTKPPGEDRGIHSRLLSKNPGSDLVARFYELFGDGEYRRLQEPIQFARACAKQGRFELASGYYQEALRLQTRNWVLLNEVSMFLTYSMRDPKAAANLAKIALGLNPTCSADLWNTLGDALYEWGRTVEAKGAYEKAITINAADVRSRFNLAFVHVREKNYDAALRRIAEAFTLDKAGEYRDRLMQKMQEVVHHVSLRHQQEYLLLINLVSRYTKPKDETDQPPQPGDKQS